MRPGLPGERYKLARAPVTNSVGLASAFGNQVSANDDRAHFNIVTGGAIGTHGKQSLAHVIVLLADVAKPALGNVFGRGDFNATVIITNTYGELEGYSSMLTALSARGDSWVGT